MTLDQFAAFAGQSADQLNRIDFTVPMKQTAVLLTADTKENFAGGHDPDGVPWLPLKRPRANSRGADKPLRDKGLLMASVTAGGLGHVEQISANQLIWGTNLDYAAVHQFGAKIQKRERTRRKPWVFPGGDGKPVFTRKIRAHAVVIPQRRFLGWSPRLRETVPRIFGEWMAQTAVRRG
jgi:phage gpG-like protein